MFMTEGNYAYVESSPHDEISNSDVENVGLSPDDHRIDVINIEQAIDGRSSENTVRNDEGRSWTMAKVQVGYDVTRKGERSLVVDGFKFTKSRDGTNNRIFWRCSRRECKATAVTVCDRVEHVRAIHAHEPPLAAEFFGNHEGVSQHCELQEVRFNTSAANMRPRYRRVNVSQSESNTEESIVVKDISNSTNNQCNNLYSLVQNSCAIKSEDIYPPTKMRNIEIKPASCLLPSPHQKPPNSVKDQVREFILRNSTQISNYPQNNGVSVAQFLISPASQSPFLQANNNSAVSSSSCNSSTVFNFNPVHIGSLSNNGLDSTSDLSSLQSAVGAISVQPVPQDDNSTMNRSNDPAAMNQMHMEEIIQMLLKSSANRKRSSSDSEWSSPTPGPGLSQNDRPPNSPTILSAGLPDGYQVLTPSRFVHWKKERLRESELCDQTQKDSKRRFEDYSYDSQSDHFVNTTYVQSPELEPEPRQLSSMISSFRPTITKKLMDVMRKLTSELCPEEAVAQEVFEKCTAIKTCLETLEKVHSLASV